MLAALHKLTKLAHFASGHEAALGRLFSTVTGLPVAEERDEVGECVRLLAPLRPLIDANRFDDLTDAAQLERAASSFTTDGIPKFALHLSLFDELAEPHLLGPDVCEAALPRLQAWWNDSDRNASSSAVLALAMARTGYAYDAHKSSWLSGSRYEDLRAGYNHLARQIFADSANDAGDCYLWHRNQVRFGILEGASQQEIGCRFHLALQHERYDIPLYLERAFSLLPHGKESSEDLDVFVHASVARTRDRYGMMMYARIYSAIADQSALPDLDVDRHLLMRGLADWFAHFPTQHLANRYAAVAHWTGDLDKVRELFTQHIRELHPTAWFDAAQPYIAWYDAGLSTDKRKAVA
jgi:hypothetical protein